MNELNLKQIQPIVYILVCVGMFGFLLWYINVEEKKEENYQKILTELARQEQQKKMYLMGKFDQKLHGDFILVPKEYTADGTGEMYLRKEALTAFLKMEQAAKNDAIKLKISSATRNFNYQKQYWNDVWTGAMDFNWQNLAELIPNDEERFAKILEYLAVPGTSRHHWGTDIDINWASSSYFDTEKGKREYIWLVENAKKFGFCQTYRSKALDRRTGYNEEKWHWSYLPLARSFTHQYEKLIKDEDLGGFSGDEYLPEHDVINNYVLSINPECR